VIDLVLPKQRILEIYLNIAELGLQASSVRRPAPSMPSTIRLDAVATRAALLAAILPNRSGAPLQSPGLRPGRYRSRPDAAPRAGLRPAP